MAENININLIRAPIPIKALKHINMYLLESDGEKFLIDTGTPTEDTISTLRQRLKGLGYEIKDLDGVIITHMHIDHIGNASLIEKEANIPVYIGAKEFKFVEYFILSQEESLRDMSELFESSGVPKGLIYEMFRKHPALSRRKNYELIENINLLNDGDEISIGSIKLKAIETPGHSPHHMCFYIEEEKTFFSGDHILFDITPNISFPRSENGDPLGDYINSLDKVKNLEAIHVKSSHRDQLTTLKKRVEELKEHHFHRLLEVAEILSKDKLSAYETASKMTWDVKFPWEKFPPHQVFFAVSEAIAHIKYLDIRGYLSSDFQNGVIKFKFVEDLDKLKTDLIKQLRIEREIT